MKQLFVCFFFLVIVTAGFCVAEDATVEYRILATSKTSTMQKEMNEAADAGFAFNGVMGGETAFGGDEVVVLMSRATGEQNESGQYEYKLLATSKTSTMQKELQEAGDAGFQFVGLTVSGTKFGGSELVTILRRKVAE